MQNVNKDECAHSQLRACFQSQSHAQFNNRHTNPNLSYAGAAKQRPSIPNDDSLDASIHNSMHMQDFTLNPQPIRATPYNRFDNENTTNILKSLRDVQNQLQSLTSA